MDTQVDAQDALTELSNLRSKHSGFTRSQSLQCFNLSLSDATQSGACDLILTLWKQCQKTADDVEINFAALKNVLGTELSMLDEAELTALEVAFESPDNINFLQFWNVVERDFLIPRGLCDISDDHGHLQEIRTFRAHVLNLATENGVASEKLDQVLTELRKESCDADFWLRVGEALPVENGFVSFLALASAAYSWCLNDVKAEVDAEGDVGSRGMDAIYEASWSNLNGGLVTQKSLDCMFSFHLSQEFRDGDEEAAAGEPDRGAAAEESASQGLAPIDVKAGSPKASYVERKKALADARAMSPRHGKEKRDATPVASVGGSGSLVGGFFMERPSREKDKTREKLQEKVDKLGAKVTRMKARNEEVKAKNVSLESQLSAAHKSATTTAAEFQKIKESLEKQLEQVRQDALKKAQAHSRTVETLRENRSILENRCENLERRVAELTEKNAELARKDQEEDAAVEDDPFASFFVPAASQKETKRTLQEKVDHLEEYVRHLHEKNTDAPLVEEEAADDAVNSRVHQLTRHVHFWRGQCTTLLKVLNSAQSSENRDAAALVRESLDEQREMHEDLAASLRTETVIREDLESEVRRLHARMEKERDSALVSTFLPSAAESACSVRADRDLMYLRKPAAGVETVQVGKAKRKIPAATKGRTSG